MSYVCPRASSIARRTLRAETHQARTTRRFRLMKNRVNPHTVSPSLLSCSASGGAARLLSASASFLSSSCDSPRTETRDASERYLPPKRRNVYPYLARSWRPVATFTAWVPRGVWAPHSLTRGTNVSRRSNRFGGSTSSVLWACCSHRADAIVPLTSLSLPLGIRENARSRLDQTPDCPVKSCRSC
jgi:hypothetical protein